MLLVSYRPVGELAPRLEPKLDGRCFSPLLPFSAKLHVTIRQRASKRSEGCSGRARNLKWIAPLKPLLFKRNVKEFRMRRYLIVALVLAGLAFSASPSWAFGPARRVTRRVGTRVAVGVGVGAAVGVGAGVAGGGGGGGYSACGQGGGYAYGGGHRAAPRRGVAVGVVVHK